MASGCDSKTSPPWLPRDWTQPRMQTFAPVLTKTRPDYARIKLYLKEIKAVSPDIRFVYTYRIDPAGKVSFVVDAEDATSTDMSHVGEEYDEVTPLMRHAYKASTPVRTENAFTTDKWGTWLSCYGSVTDATGGVECALGIDMSGKAVRDMNAIFC
jgi:hypothetical protein